MNLFKTTEVNHDDSYNTRSGKYVIQLSFPHIEVFTLLHWFLGNSGNSPAISAEFRWNWVFPGMVPGISGMEWVWEWQEWNIFFLSPQVSICHVIFSCDNMFTLQSLWQPWCNTSFLQHLSSLYLVYIKNCENFPKKEVVEHLLRTLNEFKLY